MIRIEFPEIKPAINVADKKNEQIFCIIRKRWISLTPEEWVRQNFILYLIHVLNYPASLIAVEKQLLLGDVKKRFDIIVYKNAVPFMVVECKEMNVKLNDAVLDQALRYNINMQASLIVITNGSYCYAWQKNGDRVEEMEELPVW